MATKQELGLAFPFYQHGVNFTDPASGGVNLVGNCPFSGKENKFYVNKESGLWDSKVTGKQGNLYTFIRAWYIHCVQTTKPSDLTALANSREFPTPAFLGDVAYNRVNDSYLIPSYNYEGALNQLSIYRVGVKGILRTAGTKSSLKNCHLLKDNDLPVYLFEGEWDMYAGQYLFKLLDYPAVCLCLPGATNLNKDWIPYFAGKRVFCCFDNDDAGRMGENKAANMLRGVAEDVKFLRWADGLPDGYDVRDFILDSLNRKILAATRPKLQAVFDSLHKLFYPETTAERNAPLVKPSPKENIVIPSRQELEETFSKHLKLRDYDPLTIMFGSVFANRLPQGEPIWLFMVAPPGGGKTALVSTLSKSPFIETLTTLTVAALVSGHRGTDGTDPSILPKLNNRVLVVKDFTTILTAHHQVRDEIFGYLRDIYDGKIEKAFSGHMRKYESKFGIIAAVTPVIDTYMTAQNSLGERFIKYRLDRDLSPETEKDRVRRAIMGINKENKMREELCEVVYRLLEKPIPEEIGWEDESQIDRVVAMAMFCAKMRAMISRDKFTGEQLSMPTKEIGTRLAKQLAKLAMGIAIYLGHDKIGSEELRLLSIVAADTVPDRTDYVIKTMYLFSPEEPVDTRWLMDKTGLTQPTLFRIMDDMHALKLVIKTKHVNGSYGSSYRIHPETLDLVKRSGVYATGTPASMPASIFIRRARVNKPRKDRKKDLTPVSAE